MEKYNWNYANLSELPGSLRDARAGMVGVGLSNQFKAKE
jgi:hypothetical protein